MKENISELIKNAVSSPSYKALNIEEMISSLSIEKSERGEFLDTLCYMEEIYEICFSKNGKIVSGKSKGYLKGEFSSSSRGNFGFVNTDEGEFFIPPKFVMTAMDKDTVVIRKFQENSRFAGKGNEAEIVAIVEHGVKTFTGEFCVLIRGKKILGEVRPDSEKLNFTAFVSSSEVKGAKDGDKVVCRIISYPQYDGDRIKAVITQVLGESKSKDANYKAILFENDIATEFGDEVLRQAEEVSNQEISPVGRSDFRNRNIFTIDNETAKDLDDAISVEKTESGYVLGVHIADVSHYVCEKTALDKEAHARGTSVYFTDKVVPMLPKSLSNGACSLNAGVDRYCLSALIDLDSYGNIKSVDIENSIINSKVRGVYSELNDIIEKDKESDFYQKYAHVIDDFRIMLELYSIFRKKSIASGALDLESDEAEIILDENGHPTDIIKRERGETEKLIEQFMLCANRAVASYLNSRSMPCVYRIHEEPDEEKISSFAIFAHNLGVDVSSIRNGNITPLSLSKVLDSAKDMGKGDIVSSVLLRSLMKAKYSNVPKIHFGLATNLYCHFTSPIRRYPDLSVHRILKYVLSGKTDASSIKRLEKFAKDSAVDSSANEIKATCAEREIEDLYKTVYMGDRIGEEFDAVISSVTSFGFFAKCSNLCEGLVPIASLGQNFYFDEQNLTLSHGKTVYALGMNVKIRVINADIVKRRVNFALCNAPTEEPDFRTDYAYANDFGILPKKKKSKDSRNGFSGKNSNRSKSHSKKGYRSEGKSHQIKNHRYSKKKR